MSSLVERLRAEVDQDVNEPRRWSWRLSNYRRQTARPLDLN